MKPLMNLRIPLLFVALTACTGSQAPLPEARLAVHIAPLTLTGVSDACYTLEVYAGATLVTSKTHVCASKFGDAAGSVAYVAACDASGTGASTVKLVVEDLCQGGPCAASAPGATSIPTSEWRNPCAGPGGCTQPATCLPNADVPVTFDLVIARSANQGFFDVAVTFNDIFCSAKADCRDEGGQPLTLLFDPTDDTRKQTAVVAFACTAGPGADTHLYYDNLVIQCGTTSYPYDPSLGPGNVGPGAAPFVFQSATYRTLADNGIASWNMAFGIKTAALPAGCVIKARATASDGALTDFTTPAGAVYPYIEWQVPLSSTAGTLACGRHALDEDGSGIETKYSSARAFSHAMKASTVELASHHQNTCVDTITSLTGDVSFTASPEGVTARIGNAQSPFYPLDPQYSLAGCCGNPCCE